MKKYWFFDLDGTLADTDADIRLAWKAAMADLGLVYPDFDRDFVAGPPIEEMARRFFPSQYSAELVAGLRERFGFHYDGDGFPSTKEYPGVIDAVKALKSAGARVFIATNKRFAGASAMSRHFGWDCVFENLYTGDMYKDDPAIGKMRKPQLLAMAMRMNGASADDSVMVGDTVNDFEAARENGVTSVGVAWGYGKNDELLLADAVVSHPAEILAFSFAPKTHKMPTKSFKKRIYKFY